jgi:methyl-accepting chemotaxis protein
MAVALSIGLFAVISLFSHINVKLSEKRLLKMAGTEASKISDSIKSSLEEAMLSGDTKRIQAIVDVVSMQDHIEDIKIMSGDGRVKWAKNKAETGAVMDRTKIKTCAVCHKGDIPPKRESLTSVFEKEDGTRILRNVNPIDNKEECSLCHYSDKKVLGKLLVDFSIKDTDAVVSKNRNMLIVSAAATLLSAVMISMFVFGRLVVNPVGRLFKKVEEVANGNLDAVVEIKGSDEIALLGSYFNDMVAGIRHYISMIKKEHVDERLTLSNVCEILNRSRSIDEDVELILNAVSIGFGVEECTAMILDEAGNVTMKGFTGMDADRAELIRDYMETIFELSSISLSKEYSEVSSVIGEKDKILEGEIFVAPGNGADLADFLVVPLKAGGRILGAITVHKMKDRDIKDEEIKGLFSIIATSVAPHFYIGISQEDKKLMKTGPFNSFIESIEDNINRVKEYYGSLSLALFYAENYKMLCRKMGIREASDYVNEMGIKLSSAMGVVNETIRISEDRIAVLLPMITKSEAMDIISKALAEMPSDIAFVSTVVSFPEDGESALHLLHSTYQQEIDLAKSGHRIFMGKIALCLSGNLKLQAEQLPDNHSCRFGRWYDGEGKQLCGHTEAYKAIDGSHMTIHELAKDAVNAFNAGDKERAQRIYNEMEAVSEVLMKLLDTLKRESSG